MPKIIIILIFWISALSLTACSTFSTEVIPQSGLTMEQVYDGTDVKTIASNSTETADVKILRQQTYQTSLSNQPKVAASDKILNLTAFHKLPNPTLQLYVYPHLAGNSEVPIPGYYTAVSAYERDYYALPSEVANH